MQNTQLLKWWFTLALIGLLIPIASSQELTGVEGVVTDGDTGEPLPFVEVYFQGTQVGTTTDIDGNYEIETLFASDTLEVAYLGYDTQSTFVVKGKRRQKINFVLGTGAVSLNTVEVKAKKRRYRKKDNPAVELIENVIKNRDQNRYKSKDFYEYEKYEKVELALNNITEDFKKKKIFKKLQFMFDNVDTSELNGKAYLPVFLRESSSSVYYRQNPEDEKEYRHAVNITGIDDFFDTKSLSTMMDVLYQDVNVYDAHLMLFATQFTSPTHPLSPEIYKFYILDTLQYQNDSVINLSFFPRDEQGLAFKGNMYVTYKDSSYAIVKASLETMPNINLNFVQAMSIEQEFDERESVRVLSKDKVVVDYGLRKNGRGFFGTRTVSYQDQKFGIARPDSIYSPALKVIEAPDALEKGEEYWTEARHDTLSASEAGVYQMVDSLQNVRLFRNLADIVVLISGGYKSVGPIDVGPVGAFYSFNDVEGFRLRGGGRTNLDFSKKWMLEAYAAYGFGDERWKYSGGATYSFRDNFRQNPLQQLNFSYQRDVNFVSQQLQFVSESNLFLSFKRGNQDRMLMNERFRMSYLHETYSDFHYELTATHEEMEPLGSLEFKTRDEEGNPTFLNQLTNTEGGIRLRYAPNEQFIQGLNQRTPLFNRYPVFEVNYRAGLEGIAGGDFAYHRISGSVFKRFYMSILGISNLEIEGGKIFGEQLPYTFLYMPRANQTYTYEIRSFNMMNFLEFAADDYVTFNWQHFFGGLIFNRIPLLKKLKLREVVTFKGVYGRVSSANDPEDNPQMVQWATEADGTPITYRFDDGPYLEGSVGVMNILKFGRVDLLRRLTYLDHPNIPKLWGVKGLGIRVRVVLEF